MERFFSHRTHRFNRTHLRTVSIPQKASGIQISQSVTAIFNTNKGQRKAYILFYRGISVITPLPSGGGVGGRGRYLYGPLCVLFFCVNL